MGDNEEFWEEDNNYGDSNDKEKEGDLSSYTEINPQQDSGKTSSDYRRIVQHQHQHSVNINFSSCCSCLAFFSEDKKNTEKKEVFEDNTVEDSKFRQLYHNCVVL